MRPVGDQWLELPSTVGPAGCRLDSIEGCPGNQFITDVSIRLERASESGQHPLDVDASLLRCEIESNIRLCVVTVLRVQVRRACMVKIRI